MDRPEKRGRKPAPSLKERLYLHFPSFLQPFDTPTLVSLLIPLQTVLVWTPTAIALRWPLAPAFATVNLFQVRSNRIRSSHWFGSYIMYIYIYVYIWLYTYVHIYIYMNNTTCLQASYIPPFPACFATLRHSNLGITVPDFVLRLLHRLQNFALLRFVFSFQSFPPFFPTLRHSNLGLGITAHPLANCLGPNPNGHCSPLTFGSLLFSTCSTLCPAYLSAFLRFLPAILPRFPPFSSMPHLFPMPFLHFPAVFPTFFLPFLRNLGRIEVYRHHIA